MNDLHHVPGSGLLLSANEGIQMGAYFVPQLGPAPRWASFLENMTEELEDGEATTRGVKYDCLARLRARTLAEGYCGRFGI